MELKIQEIWDRNITISRITLESYLKIHTKTLTFLYVYRPIRMVFDLKEIYSFLKFLYSVPTDKKGICLLPVFVDLDGIKFSDKLVYIMLETIIYHLTYDKKWAVSIVGNFEPENCSTAVMHSSIACGNWSIQDKCSENFENLLMSYNSQRWEKYKHFRYCRDGHYVTRFFVHSSLPKDEHREKTTNIHTSDVYDFFEDAKDLIEEPGGNYQEIAQMVFELIDNCFEHTGSKYMYDIDIKKVIHGNGSSLKGNSYVAVNIAILDISNVRIGDAIKKKINAIESSSSEEEFNLHVGGKKRVFERLLKAKNAHHSHWNVDGIYDENVFFALSAFQPGVTGREHPGLTGGAGLAHVLDYLRGFSDHYKCYCLSGDTIINMDKMYLNTNDDGWYSFNREIEKNFINHAPSEGCIAKSDFFYPGTAFFIHLELNGGSK